MTKSTVLFGGILGVLLMGLWSCQTPKKEPSNQPSKAVLTQYVDPFIGTAGHGHTYPGATVPFGMVQVSPDNGTTGLVSNVLS